MADAFTTGQVGTATVPGRSPTAHQLPLPSAAAASTPPGALPSSGTTTTSGGAAPPSPSSASAFCPADAGPGLDWFEAVHVVPRRLDLGFVTTRVVHSLEVFNAYRATSRSWTAASHDAGNGVSLSDLPSFPKSVPALRGESFKVTVATNGPAEVSAHVTATLDAPGSIKVPLTFSRVVLVLPVRPQGGITEVLRFRTDVQVSEAGDELREAMQSGPVQSMSMRARASEGPESQALELALLDRQSARVAAPVFFEEGALNQDASKGSSTLSLDTQHADYRVGSYAAVFPRGGGDPEVVTVASVAAGSLGIDGELANAYSEGDSVFPVRVCWLSATVPGSRPPSGFVDYDLEMTVDEAPVDLASTSAFSSLDGKVYLDQANAMEGESKRDGYQVLVVDLQSEGGVVHRSSPRDRSTRTFPWVARLSSRQELWEYRQLLHALRGRQVSFYARTHSQGLRVAADLQQGSALMDVSPVGYPDFGKQSEPRLRLRVQVKSGTVVLRKVVESRRVGSVERLTLDGTWPEDVPAAEVESAEWVVHARLASDEVQIVHESGLGDALVTLPLRVLVK